MTRLVTFGCSHTFGQGLPDCYDIETKRTSKFPSKMGWPQHLANLLQIPILVNKGVPGASCKQIAWNIQNFQFQKDDVAVVLWTHLDRYCVITENGIVKPYGSWLTSISKENKMFFKHIWNEYDMKIDMHTRIDYINYFLSKKQIKNYHAYLNNFNKITDDWFSTTMLKSSMSEIRNMYPRALDNMHPGLEAHNVFAHNVYREIIEA